MSVTYLRFGILTCPLNYDISSLAKPFDLLTWSLVIGSTLSICLYFRIFFQLNRKERSLLEIHVLSVLLEQSQDIDPNCKFFKKKTCLVLMSWMLLTFLVGNAYKGVLFTILTTPKNSAIPPTLQDAVFSNISVVSTHREDNGFLAHFFAESETQKLLKTLHSRPMGDFENSTLNLYEKLKERTSYTFTTISNLFILMKVGFEEQETYEKQKFLILNPEKDMEHLKELNRLLTKNALVLGEKLNLLEIFL